MAGRGGLVVIKMEINDARYGPRAARLVFQAGEAKLMGALLRQPENKQVCLKLGGPSLRTEGVDIN